MASTDGWDGASPWLFLLGFVLFLGSLVLFVADVVRQLDVLRGIALNAVAAVVLIAWAAHDTLFDPNSEVATTGGAAGTALLLYGLYLVLAGLVVSATGLWHDYFVVGLLYLLLAVGTVLVGLLIFPTEAVIADGAETPPEESATSADRGTDTDGSNASRADR